MDTVFQTGKTKEELFQALEAVDSIETLDNLIVNNDEITVKLKRKNGKLSGWELCTPMSQLSSGIKQKGRGLKSLEKLLNKQVFMSSLTAEMSPLIIVHCSTSECREYDGRVITTWFIIDPYEPYVESGDYGFDTIQIELTNEEYKLALETRIALYEANANIIYPIRKSAFPNIGKMLDCATLYFEDCPIGVAMILAKCFEDQKKMKGVRFLCLNTSKRVKPITSVVSKNYQRVSKLNFIQDFLVWLSSFGKSYTIAEWSVDNYEVIVEIILSESTRCGKNGFFLHVSDIPGWPVTVTTFRKMEGNYIYLRKTSIEHRKAGETIGFQAILRQAWEDFEDCDSYFSDLKVVSDPEKILREFEMIIGKRRLSDILKDNSLPSEMDGEEFLHFLLRETNVVFTRNSRKWENMLREKYFEVLKRISLCKFQENERKIHTSTEGIEFFVSSDSQMMFL